MFENLNLKKVIKIEAINKEKSMQRVAALTRPWKLISFFLRGLNILKHKCVVLRKVAVGLDKQKLNIEEKKFNARRDLITCCNIHLCRSSLLEQCVTSAK